MLLNREQWLFCLQICLAMMLAYLVTHGSEPANAIYAVLGAGLATTPSVGESLGLSRERIVGTLLGALVSLSAIWLQDPTLALGVTAVIIAPIGMLIGGIAVARIAVTMAAVTVVLHTDSAGLYAFYRFTNTIAGVAVAVAVAFALWPLSRRLNFSATLQSTLTASGRLAEQLAKHDATVFPLEGQKKLFIALSVVPKAIIHIGRDPLLYGQRERIRQEARLVAAIGIALLATSLTFGRATLRPEQRTKIQACYRHLAKRLHKSRHYFSSSPPVRAGPLDSTMVIEPSEGVPPPYAQIAEELRAVDEMLDELDTLMDRAKPARP